MEVEGRPEGEGFEGGVGGRGGLGNEGGGGGGGGRGGDEVCRGLVSNPEACVKMANTLFGEKKLSELTVVELNMELDNVASQKKALRVSLQNGLDLLVIM